MPLKQEKQEENAADQVQIKTTEFCLEVNLVLDNLVNSP